MTNYTPPRRMICRSCHRPLDALDALDGELTYVHAVIPEVVFGRCDKLDPIDVGDDVGDLIGVCDFCSVGLPRWNYPAADFELPTPPGVPFGSMSQGAWGACDECHDLIEIGHWNDLANRSLDKWPPEARAKLRPWVTAMHKEFKAHRTGLAVELWAEL